MVEAASIARALLLLLVRSLLLVVSSVVATDDLLMCAVGYKACSTENGRTCDGFVFLPMSDDMTRRRYLGQLGRCGAGRKENLLHNFRGSLGR
jgi:hypothetical protein